MAIRMLAHHIDVEFLHVAYQRTRKDADVGVTSRIVQVTSVRLSHGSRGNGAARAQRARPPERVPVSSMMLVRFA
jgi:hypothetical protein